MLLLDYLSFYLLFKFFFTVSSFSSLSIEYLNLLLVLFVLQKEQQKESKQKMKPRIKIHLGFIKNCHIERHKQRNT
jgi:hypothetical protein